MVAAIAVPIKAIYHESRDVRCTCGRFLTQTKAHVCLPAYTVWIRVKCQGCDHWKWIDTATGEVLNEPKPPMIY